MSLDPPQPLWSPPLLSLPILNLGVSITRNPHTHRVNSVLMSHKPIVRVPPRNQA